MLKVNGQFEPDEDASNESNSTGDFLIGDTIIEEEERLAIENEKMASRNEKFSDLGESKENIETEEDLKKKREAEIKEKRYKRLMHLLNNSKMYTVILKSRIEEEEVLRKKNSGASNQNSEESGLKRQNSQKQYDLLNLITEKCIDESVAENKVGSTGVQNLETDFFKETRVTDLGFTVSYEQPVLLEGGAMRDYQLQGLKWMSNLFMNGVNGILADEMGLGKTIQVISFICYLIEKKIKGPFLIVAPLSTVTNWLAEFKRFAPKVPTLLYHGSEADRKLLYQKILKTSKCGNETCYKVVITSFQIPIRDRAVLEKINWYYLIIDEGHRIKNYNSLLSRVLREFNTIGRLLLTGTPLQNDLSELWSLLNFLLPEVFKSLDVFESWFDIRELEKNGTKFIQEKFNIDVVNILQEILVPFLLRREKKDVNLQLPPKKEILIYCPLTQCQKQLYQATIDRSIEFLLKPKEDVNLEAPLPKRRCFLNSRYGYGNPIEKSKTLSRTSQNDFPLLTGRRENGRSPSEGKPRRKESPVDERFLTNIVLRNPQMQLRKIVNHPYLIQFPLRKGTEELRIDEELVQTSGKLLVLDAMLAKLKARGHKVLIFSFFKTLLDILEDYVIMRKYEYCRLDGDSKIADRDEEILRFVSNPDVFVFLISIRAGGLGINLTAADTVIFYDSDWNPQVNLQAQDRCHRIGQTKPVVVYTLCAIGTLDERILERGNAKRRLEKMILQKGKFTLNSKSSSNLNVMDLQELKKLFESTGHDAVINSNGFVLSDKELEALLDRSHMSDDSSSTDDGGSKVFKVLNYKH